MITCVEEELMKYYKWYLSTGVQSVCTECISLGLFYNATYKKIMRLKEFFFSSVYVNQYKCIFSFFNGTLSVKHFITITTIFLYLSDKFKANMEHKTTTWANWVLFYVLCFVLFFLWHASLNLSSDISLQYSKTLKNKLYKRRSECFATFYAPWI